jgi:hypothetical protein
VRHDTPNKIREHSAEVTSQTYWAEKRIGTITTFLRLSPPQVYIQSPYRTLVGEPGGGKMKRVAAGGVRDTVAAVQHTVSALLVLLASVLLACASDGAPASSSSTPDPVVDPTEDVPGSTRGDSGPGCLGCEVSAATEPVWGACDDDKATRGPGCPCTDNGDCDSGWCITDPDGGSVCTSTCIDECPIGWACKGLTNLGSDITFICVPRWTGQCRPCQTDGDCELPDSKCLAYQGAERYCGTVCDSTAECPADFDCDAGHCRRVVGECTCSESAVADGAETLCTNTNPIGSCEGTRACGPAGLSACSAATPAAETCDGADNDCDGLTDEACTNSSHGNLFGDGAVLNSDNGQFFMRQTLGSPRITGAATNGQFTMRHGLLKPGGGL